MTHNKKRIPFLSLLKNCISAKSALLILIIENEYTSCYLNFLTIGLRSYSDNSLF